MRDRLIELIKDIVHPYFAETIADHLLANGVIVPPCKVGDTVWVHNQTAGKIFKNTVVGIFVSGASPHRNGIKCEYRNICGETSNRKFTFAQIGKTVFLTREEAEQALKGEHHG